MFCVGTTQLKLSTEKRTSIRATIQLRSMRKLFFSEKVPTVGKVFARFTMDERSSIRGANSEQGPSTKISFQTR